MRLRRFLMLLGLCAACGPGKQTTHGPALSPQSSLRLILHHPGDTPAPSDTCEAEHCQALLERIEGAERTIDFAVYGMRKQSRIFEALQQAKDRGVLVRGIVDRDREGENIYSGTDALAAMVGKVHDDRRADERLARREARQRYDGEPQCDRPPGYEGPLQCLAYDLGDTCLLAAHASREPLDDGDAIMHNKFFVVDSRYVWTGSTNISDSGTGGYNANLVALLDAPHVAKWYVDEFEQMYTGGRYHALKHSAGVHQAELGNAFVELLFSPQDHPIKAAVRPLLQQARERIDIAVFFLTHKLIAEDLIETHRRGVKVRIILDATGATNEYTKHELLRAAGIPVKVESWGGKMHMKSAAIDGKTVIAGSMNWTSSGEFSNDENTLLIHGDEIAQQYHAFFDTTWNGLDERWLTKDPAPESRDSGTACTDGSDNDFDGLVDAEDPGCSGTPAAVELPPWRIVPKGSRMTCDIRMDD